MTETNNESAAAPTTASFTLSRDDRDIIERVAVDLTAERNRVVSRSAALRHILAVYIRLPEAMRQVAIKVDDVS